MAGQGWNGMEEPLYNPSTARTRENPSPGYSRHSLRPTEHMMRSSSAPQHQMTGIAQGRMLPQHRGNGSPANNNVINCNNLKEDDAAFIEAARKLLHLKQSSGLPPNRVIFTLLSAQERLDFAEAFQCRLQSLSTFPEPGESARTAMLRQVNNAFGAMLMKMDPGVAQQQQQEQQMGGTSWSGMPLHRHPDDRLIQDSYANDTILSRVPSGRQEHIQEPARLTDQRESYDDRQRVNTHYLRDREHWNNDARRKINADGNTSQPYNSIAHDSRRGYSHEPPRYRESRQSPNRKSEHERYRNGRQQIEHIRSPCRSERQAPYLNYKIDMDAKRKLDPILRDSSRQRYARNDGGHSSRHVSRTLENDNSQNSSSFRAQDDIAEVMDVRPRSPDDTRESNRKVTIPSLKNANGVQTPRTESSMRQRIIKEIESTTEILATITDSTERTKYQHHLEWLVTELEGLIAASSSSPFTKVGGTLLQTGSRENRVPKVPFIEIEEVIDPVYNDSCNRNEPAVDFRTSTAVKANGYAEIDEIFSPVEGIEGTDVTSKQSTATIDNSKCVDKTPPIDQGRHIPISSNVTVEFDATNEIDNSCTDTASSSRELPEPQQHTRLRYVSVIAPADLPENFQFEAQIGNEIFIATVPKGGVRKGETFTSTMSEISSKHFQEMKVPYGQWRDDLFDCMQYGIGHPMLVTSCFCPPVALTQIMARMRLTAHGDKAPSLRSRRRVKTVLAFTIVLLSLDGFLVFATLKTSYVAVAIVIVALILMLNAPILFAFFHLVIQTRKAVRKTYSIPEGRYEGYEDMLLSIWCTACTLAQMGRHTADYDTYRALLFSDNGLPYHIEVALPEAMNDEL